MPVLSARPATGGTRLRRLARALSVTLLAVGLTVPAVAPAEAAAYATGRVCFVTSVNGGPYTYPVYSQVHVNGRWVDFDVQQTNTGCSSWLFPLGYYWRFKGYVRVGTYTNLGYSGHRLVNTAGYYNFGTWTVYTPRVW